MYFSGNCPSIVAGTFPPRVSSGLGVTVKLSAESLPNLEHEVVNNKEHAVNERIRFLFINVINLIGSAASGTRTRTAITGQGILSPSCLPIPPLRQGN